MSLLFFFKGAGAADICWTDSAAVATTWTIPESAFLDKWSEWAAFTWAQIASSGHTWAVLSGDAFLDTTTPNPAWTVVTLPSEVCT